MRIFLAGATGVIGVRLLPLMVAEGHAVAAMTRTPGKLDGLRAAGATPVLCDVFDAGTLAAAVKSFRPDLIVHQVTDLPQEIEKLPELYKANERVRSEGTRNLLAAAAGAGVTGFVAQSIAWRGGPVVEAHERSVLGIGGTVLRYGQFYGPGTYYPAEPPAAPRIQVDEAARRTLPWLGRGSGIVEIVEDGG